jgi:PKD repeat protein
MNLYLLFFYFLNFSNPSANDCVNLKIDFETNNDFHIFKGYSDQDVSLWYWSMGDGTNITGQTVRHRYEKSGTYEVCLRVRSGENCSGNICQKIEVKINESSDCDLGADFKFDLQGNNLVVAGRSNADPNVRYIWDFGDGKQDRGQEVSHKFEKNGSYNVCLTALVSSRTATDDVCSQKVCKVIEVRTNQEDNCDIKADFRFDVKGNVLTVHGRSNLGSNAQYTWIFGDEGRTQGIQARHQFKERGSYQVCLIVSTRLTTSNRDCRTRVCKTIRIGETPVVNPENDCTIKTDFTFRNDGRRYVFAGRSNDRGASYFWSISGENTRLEGQTLDYTFDTPGSYDVCLIAVSHDGKCRTRSCKKIVVGRSIVPYPNPTIDVISINIDEDIDFVQIVDRQFNTVIKNVNVSSKTDMDVSHLQTGHYTMIIHFKDGTSESKIFVKK